MFALMRRPPIRWVKYAGNWVPSGKDAFSYKVQRLWLARGLHRGVVTVNGVWPNQPGHVLSFENPSLTEQDIRQGKEFSLTKEISPPVSLLFVGRVEAAKGVGRLLSIASRLKQQGFPFSLDIIGDGMEKPAFIRQATEAGLDDVVRFHGWLSKREIVDYYARAHLLVFPTSASEGWPKVLSEGMAYGVVPIAGEVSSIPQLLRGNSAGVALPPDDIQGFTNAILDYSTRPEKWRAAVSAGLESAGRFTYERYLCVVKDMFQKSWGIRL
jgi:glycosyltransferase involved in cell wall biosynthesis